MEDLTLVICPNDLKMDILDSNSQEESLMNLKFIDKKEVDGRKKIA